MPPSRDEESETQRKAHAKRVRETRRSTQGVTLDEIKSAEELIKKNNMNNNNNVSLVLSANSSARVCVCTRQTRWDPINKILFWPDTICTSITIIYPCVPRISVSPILGDRVCGLPIIMRGVFFSYLVDFSLVLYYTYLL